MSRTVTFSVVALVNAIGITSLAEAQTPFVANLYLPNPTLIDPNVLVPPGTWVDMPQTDMQVTVPAGTAVITWAVEDGLNNAFRHRPMIGSLTPPDGLGQIGGSWVTPVDAGVLTVRMQVRQNANQDQWNWNSTTKTHASWTLVVYPPSTAPTVPAVSNIGLVIMVTLLLGAGSFVLKRWTSAVAE